jgi:hypothetical protein
MALPKTGPSPPSSLPADGQHAGLMVAVTMCLDARRVSEDPTYIWSVRSL